MLGILTYLGVAVFAVSGAISAGRKQLDLLAVVLVAMVTALGGGTLRDVMLDVRPLPWIADNNLLWISIAAAIGTMIWQRRVRHFEPGLVYADAMGLALFSVLATERALLAGAGPLVATIMGMVTSITGGIVRDILCGNPPLVMRGEVYATCSLLGSLVFLGLRAIDVPVDGALVIGASAALSLRLLAIRMGLRVPGFVWNDDPRLRR
jgi:uncharacterized membrane protein YeiH